MSVLACFSATPADVALLMQLGVDGVFVGSGIFKSSEPAKRAAAMVQAVTHYDDARTLATISENLGVAMVGAAAAGTGFMTPCALLKLDFLTSAYNKCMALVRKSSFSKAAPDL